MANCFKGCLDEAIKNCMDHSVLTKIVMEAAKACKETIQRDGNDDDMCLPSFVPPVRLAEDQISFKSLLQNLDPVRLARAAQKLDFSK
ncbi:hypothetical protein CU097_003522, partial [Rhizopus azygosporus]